MNKIEKIADHSFDLDEEEQLIEESIVRGEYKVDKTRAEAQAEWNRDLAATTKKKPITIRLNEIDIRLLKVRALEVGIPYQTLLSSILHRYTTGRLKEVD
jgi:predicted DNA binding CopG/RHH family protein